MPRPEDAEDSDHHGIADVLINATHDELLGGFQGGGVPFPTVAKSRFVQTIRLSPRKMKTEPMIGKAMFHGDSGHATPVR